MTLFLILLYTIYFIVYLYFFIITKKISIFIEKILNHTILFSLFIAYDTTQFQYSQSIILLIISLLIGEFITFLFNSNKKQTLKRRIVSLIQSFLLKSTFIVFISYAINTIDYLHLLAIAIGFQVFTSIVNEIIRIRKNVLKKYSNLELLTENDELKTSLDELFYSHNISNGVFYKYRNNNINSHLVLSKGKWNVILSSGAINNLSKSELRAIILHEMAHIKKKHKLFQVLLNNLFNILFILFNYILILHFSNIDYQPLQIVLICIIISQPFILLNKVIYNWLLRIQELQADRFSSKNSSAKTLQKTLYKIQRTNKSYNTKNRLIYLLKFSHPTLETRILNLT